MADHHNTTQNFAAHSDSYAGFLGWLKYGTIGVAVIVAIVILVIT